MMFGCVAAGALSLVAAATALPAASNRPVRVLFIGNSYTFFNDLPHMFGNLSLHLRQPVEVDTEMVAPGGSSLFQHGNLSLPMGQATAAALAEPGGWDFVMLQDQSETPGGGCDTDSGLAPGEVRPSLPPPSPVFAPHTPLSTAFVALCPPLSTWLKRMPTLFICEAHTGERGRTRCSCACAQPRRSVPMRSIAHAPPASLRACVGRAFDGSTLLVSIRDERSSANHPLTNVSRGPRTTALQGFTLSSAALSSFFVPRLTQAHATPVLYSTWGRHDGDPPNAECCGYGTFLSMTARTTAGYRSYADTLTAGGLSPRIAPAGKAFEIVHNASSNPTGITSNFSCLYNHADAVQSSDLSVASTGVDDGVVRSRSGTNCTLDGAGLGGHPSVLGTFLIAATMAGVVHGQRTASVGWAPEGVDPAHRSYLLQVADTAVFGAP